MLRLYRKTISIILLLMVVLFENVTAYAAEQPTGSRLVKVGYMNHPGFITDAENGAVVGYGVEYFDTICRYTGWTVEYVYAPWIDQLEMLERGEIDIVPIAQYSEERAEHYLFSHQPVGLLQCLLFTVDEGKDSFELNADYCDGKRIGILRGTRNIDLLRNYAERMGFSYTLTEYDYQDTLEEALFAGEVDIIACEQMVNSSKLAVVDRFGSDTFYFIMSKENRALMDELDLVISEINSYDPSYQSKLYIKYFGDGIMNEKPYFTKEEIEFIAQCGDITLVLLPDSRPGVYTDENGKPVGIIPDIMTHVSKLSGINFDYKFLPDNYYLTDFLRRNPEYIAAGASSEIIAPNSNEFLVTDSYYTSYFGFAVREDYASSIDIGNGKYTVGIPAQYSGICLKLNEEFPNLTPVDYPTIDSGMSALAKKDIDMLLSDLDMIMSRLGNPRYGDITFVEDWFMPNTHCTIAANTRENRVIISIMDKCISTMSTKNLAGIENSHLRRNVYRYKDSDALYRYRYNLLTLCGIVAVVFIALLIRQLRYTKKVEHNAEQDLMTGVYNRATALAYMQRYLSSNPGNYCSFMLVDIDNLKKINDTYGHAAGDEAIRGVANVLKSSFRETDIVTRIGGDEFAVFLKGIGSKAAMTMILERIQNAISSTCIANGKHMLSSSIGVAIGKAGRETLDELYSHADEVLYKIKKSGKSSFAYYE